MARAAALGLVVLTAAIARRAAGDDPVWTGAPLTLGLALIAAALAGEIFERVRLPRITGYLVFGILCGPYVADLVDRAMAREIHFVNGLAIALIAYMAGLELNLARIAPRLGAVVRLGATTLGTCYIGLFTLLWATWPWLPIDPEATGAARLAEALLLATVVVSFSPTVTIAVIADSRARGPLTELVISLVVLADLALILMFTVVMQAARAVFGLDAGGDVSIVVDVTWSIIGSLAFGAFAGSLFGLYLRFVGRELTVVLLALCAGLTIARAMWHVEPLLAALAAGLVVENVAGAGGDRLRDAVERGSLPVLVVFFAAAGMSIHLDALAAVGVAALLLAAARLALVRAGTWLGTRASGLDSPHAQLAWMGLVSQAGVTFGLTMIVASEFPAWGAALQTLMVAMIALHELVGPVLFKAGLTRMGEVGRMDEDVEARR
jgi:Kef-type K+ transport system membrane component KefB